MCVLRGNDFRFNGYGNGQKQRFSRISLSTHSIFPCDLSHAVYLFQRLKTCFVHIHLP